MSDAQHELSFTKYCFVSLQRVSNGFAWSLVVMVHTSIGLRHVVYHITHEFSFLEKYYSLWQAPK